MVHAVGQDVPGGSPQQPPFIARAIGSICVPGGASRRRDRRPLKLGADVAVHGAGADRRPATEAAEQASIAVAVQAGILGRVVAHDTVPAKSEPEPQAFVMTGDA